MHDEIEKKFKMNNKQKLTLLLCMLTFWVTIIFLPNCGGNMNNKCDMMFGYDFMWSQEFEGVYVPMLVVEWIGIAVSFFSLFFYFEDEKIKN